MHQNDILHFSTTGDPGRQALLFVHGFLGSRHDWAEIVARLASKFFCISVDLPGHGQSLGLSPESYATRRAAAMLGRVLDRCGVQTARVIGYSMGGRVALTFALEHATRCGRLVMESCSPGLIDEEARRVRRDLDEARAKKIERAFPEFLEAWYKQPLFSTLARNPPVLQAMLARRAENDPTELARALRGMTVAGDAPGWNRLPELSMPTLAVAGALDGKYVESVERMALASDLIRSAVLPNAGHNVHVEQPSAYAELVADFFRPAG